MIMSKKLLLAGIALTCAIGAASAKELRSVGVTLGSLGNPFFVSMTKGVEAKLAELGEGIKVSVVSADYDLNKQFSQMDSFTAAGVDLILLNAADPKAIAPAVKRAQEAGIVVVAIDVAAAGADVTVQTDNVKAGQLGCQFLADKLGGQGEVVIINGPQVSSIVDRVNGCKAALAEHPGIKILSSDQDGKASRDGGLNVMQGLLTRFPKIDGVFSVNDQMAIGADLAAKQLGRGEFAIVGVDGAPDAEQALKSDTLVQATVAQDPYFMALKALEVGNEVLGGKKPAEPMLLLEPKLITRDNVKDYQGWTSR
jgi:ribose transport system substrate-binding protein